MVDVKTKDAAKVSLPFLGAAMTLVALLVTAGMCPRVSDIQLVSAATAEHTAIEVRSEKAHDKMLKRIDGNQKTIIKLLTDPQSKRRR